MTDGRIFSSKEVHCGKCGEWRGGLGRYAATELKEQGWEQQRGYGWLCPQCIAALNAEKVRVSQAKE
jgi:ribosomal protein L34E